MQHETAIEGGGLTKEKARLLIEGRQAMAKAYGYFWLACPRCGEMFAGYETGGRTANIDEATGIGSACCEWCD